MKSTAPHWFFAGLVLGLALFANLYFFFLKDLPTPEAEPYSDPFAEDILMQLQTENDRLREETESLRARLREAENQVAAARPPTTPPNFTPGPPPAGGPPADFRSMVTRAREQRFQNMLLDLKSTLGLTDDQMALLEDGLAGYRETQPDLQPLIGLSALREDGAMRRILDPLLSPDQQERLDGYIEDQRANQIEIIANAQLMQLQSMLSLSDEQKDQAFASFARIAEDRVDNPPAAGDGPGPGPAAFFEQNVEAMREVLTPEQMEIYQRAMEQQRAMVEQFRRRMEAGDNAPAPGAPGGG